MLRQKPPVIFVIQNDDLWRYWVVSTLCQAGAQVESFSLAVAAFKHLEDNALPDLVIADVQTPDLGAERFSEKVTKLQTSSCRTIPILAVASTEGAMEPSLVIELTNADGFLKLPCAEGLLLNLADMLLHESQPGAQPLVLVADDSVALRRVLASNLGYRGYKVVEAESGAQTIRMAMELNPDVIVLDHILPDMLGLAVMPHISAAGRPFVIVITGDPTQSLADEYSRLGAHAFIRKPFNIGHLLDVIDKSFRVHAFPVMNAPCAESECRQSLREERYEDLFQKLPVGVAVFSALDEGLDFSFIAMNNAAEVLLNFRPDPTGEERLSQALPASLDNGLLDSMRQALKTGAPEFISFAGSPDPRCANIGACSVLPLLSGEVALVFLRKLDAAGGLRSRSRQQ